MIKFIKMYWLFGAACLTFFMLGAYTDASLKYDEDIPIFKFIINIFFGILFLVKGVNQVKEL